VQDGRLKILSATVLPLVAFLSLAGAVAALAWWLLFTPRHRGIRNPRAVLFFLAILCATAVVVQVTAGGGVPYLFRMTVVVLLAAWYHGARKSGELLEVAVAFLGTRAGFDLGLLAEMAARSLDLLLADLGMMQIAWQMKGTPRRLGTLSPALALLLHTQLQHSGEQASLLALRGYTGGGSLCPAFAFPRHDLPAACSVLLAVAIALAVPL
jgi:energy-coupling factor transport system permease protein